MHTVEGRRHFADQKAPGQSQSRRSDEFAVVSWIGTFTLGASFFERCKTYDKAQVFVGVGVALPPLAKQGAPCRTVFLHFREIPAPPVV